MIRLHHLLLALVASTLHAGELILEMKPFFISHNLEAVVVPEAFTPVRLEPESWTEFRITSVAGHGSSVKKDQPLILFDAQGIEESLADTRHAIATGTLELAQAEDELGTLEAGVPVTLARLKRRAQHAAEELQYFLEIRRKATAEATASSLKQNEQMLDAHLTELQQLHSLRKSSGNGAGAAEKVEATLGQQERIEAAVFALHMENHNHNRALGVTLPREEVELLEKRDDTALRLAKAEKELPREIELRKLAVARLGTSLVRKKEALSGIEQDRRLFELRAPSDGVFFHGFIENGKWSGGATAGALLAHAEVPIGKNLATFIPAGTRLVVQAQLPGAIASALPEQISGIAQIPGREELEIPVSLESITPGLHDEDPYTARFAATWPEGLTVFPTQELSVRLISHSAESAIAIPSSALTFGPKGWSVEVKLADGKTEHRPVTRGRSSATETEILDGLEAGQVIIVP